MRLIYSLLLVAALAVPAQALGALLGGETPNPKPDAFVVKKVLESVTSSDVLQDDDVLTFTLAKATTFQITLSLHAESASGTPDLKFTFTYSQVASSISVHCNGLDLNAANPQEFDLEFLGDEKVLILTAGVHYPLDCEGIIETSPVADGTFTFQWAQNTSNGSATTVDRLAYMRLSDVAAIK